MIRLVGEHAVLVDAADPAGLAAAVREVAYARGLRVTDVVPGAETVLVSGPDAQALGALLPLPVDARPAGSADVVRLPVRYDGPDLASVASATGLSVDEVVARHSGATYRAAFGGFAPGFAYLTGLDPVLELPRRTSPRPVVPAGSVAIAAGYSAVYPRASPGGWHLLGAVDAVLFDPERDPPALIAPGATVRFEAV